MPAQELAGIADTFRVRARLRADEDKYEEARKLLQLIGLPFRSN